MQLPCRRFSEQLHQNFKALKIKHLRNTESSLSAFISEAVFVTY